MTRRGGGIRKVGHGTAGVIAARSLRAAVFFLAWIFFSAGAVHSEPNLEGIGGLINTPDATATEDGLLYFGFAENKNFTDNPLFHGLTQRSWYFNIGFLPNLELSARVAQLPAFQETGIPGFGDRKEREASVKFQLLAEKGSMPAFALGAADVGGGERSQRGYYAVAGKTVYKNVSATLGVGTDKFEGVFGGVRWQAMDRFELLAEYDTQGFNAGVRFSPLDWLTLSAANLDGDEWGFGVSTRLDLLDYKKRKPTEPAQPIVRWDPDGGQADPRVLTERLVELGFENVRAFTQGDEFVVFYENRRFLLEERALGIVAVLSAMHAPGGADRIRVVTLVDDTPHLDFVAPVEELLSFVRGEIDETEFRENLDVNYHRGMKTEGGVSRANPSQFKLDLFFRPGIDVDLGRKFGPFRRRLFVLLDPELKLGRGLFARGRLSYTFDNDLNDIDGFEAERGWLGFGGRFGNVSWLAKGGLLALDQVGGQLEAELDVRDSDALVGFNLVVAEDAFTDDSWVQLLGKVEKRFPKYDLITRLYAGRFQFEDRGVRAEATRFFGPVEITFFAYDAGGDSTEGGVTFYVPLPGYDESPPGRIRTGIAPDWGFSYSSERDPFGRVLHGGMDLRRYRQRLYPDYILSHLEELRRVRGWLN